MSLGLPVPLRQPWVTPELLPSPPRSPRASPPCHPLGVLTPFRALFHARQGSVEMKRSWKRFLSVRVSHSMCRVPPGHGFGSVWGGNSTDAGLLRCSQNPSVSWEGLSIAHRSSIPEPSPIHTAPARWASAAPFLGYQASRQSQASRVMGGTFLTFSLKCCCSWT